MQFPKSMLAWDMSTKPSSGAQRAVLAGPSRATLPGLANLEPGARAANEPGLPGRGVCLSVQGQRPEKGARALGRAGTPFLHHRPPGEKTRERQGWGAAPPATPRRQEEEAGEKGNRGAQLHSACGKGRSHTGLWRGMSFLMSPETSSDAVCGPDLSSHWRVSTRSVSYLEGSGSRGRVTRGYHHRFWAGPPETASELCHLSCP